jgi:hypothetical protein
VVKSKVLKPGESLIALPMLSGWPPKRCLEVNRLWVRFTGEKARLGGPKAITVTAHKIACIFYHIWSKGDAYVDPGVETYEQKYRERMLNKLQRKAQSLGFDLVPKPDVAECVS